MLVVICRTSTVASAIATHHTPPLQAQPLASSITPLLYVSSIHLPNLLKLLISCSKTFKLEKQSACSGCCRVDVFSYSITSLLVHRFSLSTMFHHSSGQSGRSNEGKSPGRQGWVGENKQFFSRKATTPVPLISHFGLQHDLACGCFQAGPVEVQ